MAHDPITAATVQDAPHLEPHFAFPDAVAAATEKLNARTTRPNVAMIVFDDVRCGDFGCCGGGVALVAPTPNIDRLAREGKVLTSCYSEPSCTPSRASLMTGRLAMRHGDGAGSNRKYLYSWLGSTFSAVRCGECKMMSAGTSDDDRDIQNSGGFSGVTQKYTYSRLYNLYLDPKEQHSYMIRKIPYLDAFTAGLGQHFRSFGKYPAKSVVGGVG